jgi:LacI family transcriptional regulator
MNSSLAEGELRSVSVDNHGGAREMVRHLAAAGHRRIAFISGPDNNFDASERLRGYRDELAASLPDARPWILEGDFHEASGHRAGGELLARPDRPDAVFAANDMMALGCLFALTHAGVQVPRDVAIAGFDDIPLARYVHPSLTTMRVDIAELGARALRTLLDSMASQAGPGDGTSQMEPLVPKLMVRDSSVAGAGGKQARVSAAVDA